MPSVTRHITWVSEGSPGLLSKGTTQLNIAYTPATIDANVPLSVCNIYVRRFLESMHSNLLLHELTQKQVPLCGQIQYQA